MIDMIRAAGAPVWVSRTIAREHLAPEALTVGAVLPEADLAALAGGRIESAVAAGTQQIERAFSAPRRGATAGAS